MNNIKKFQYNKEKDKYILEIENDITNAEGKVIGRRKWSDEIEKDHIKDVLELLKQQKETIEKGIKKSEEELKQLPKMTKQERDNIRVFSQKVAKVQQLARIEKVESEKESQLVGLNKISKDIEELENAIGVN